MLRAQRIVEALAPVGQWKLNTLDIRLACASPDVLHQLAERFAANGTYRQDASRMHVEDLLDGWDARDSPLPSLPVSGWHAQADTVRKKRRAKRRAKPRSPYEKAARAQTKAEREQAAARRAAVKRSLIETQQARRSNPRCDLCGSPTDRIRDLGSASGIYRCISHHLVVLPLPPEDQMR